MEAKKILGLIGCLLTAGCENIGELFPVYKNVEFKDTLENFDGQNFREVEKN